MSEQPKEELKIKDLLIKLQILTTGLVEERKKSQSYLERIKEYEDSLQKKDSEIVELTKEKFDLKSKLTLERSKSTTGKKTERKFSLFTKASDEEKVQKLEELVNQQKFEIKDLTQRLMEEKETFDQQKIKFQTMITLQNQQMIELKKKQQEVVVRPEPEAPKKVEVIPDKTDEVESLKRKFDVERDDYERKIAELKNQIKEEKEKYEIINNKYNQINESYTLLKYENSAMKTQVTNLNSQLSKVKIEVHNKQLAPRVFQVEIIKNGLVKNKKSMTVTFSWNKEQKRCEITFTKISHDKIKTEVVNIMDISQFKVNDKKKDNIEVVFTVSISFNI
jgi:chromosome segregation ATPase